MQYLNTIFSFLIITVIFCCCSSPNRTEIKQLSENPSAVESAFEFARVSGDTIFFTDGQYYKTRLYETGFIGMVNVGDKAPYLIYSGRDCNECDANLSLYVHSPDDGVLDVSDGQNRMMYPGKVFHYETGELIFESSTFYGEVLRGINGLIWYSNEYTESGDTLKQTFLIKLDAGGMTDTVWNHHQTLDQTIKLQVAGRCQEIATKDFTSEP